MSNHHPELAHTAGLTAVRKLKVQQSSKGSDRMSTPFKASSDAGHSDGERGLTLRGLKLVLAISSIPGLMILSGSPRLSWIYRNNGFAGQRNGLDIPP